jgi:hypothetical protein
MALKGRIKTKEAMIASLGASNGGFDVNGKFHRKHNWTRDMLNGETIDAEPMDDEFDNYADALSDCLTRDGKGKIIRDFDFNNHAGTNLQEQWIDTRAYVASVKQVMRDPTRIFTDMGTDGKTILLKAKYPGAELLPDYNYENGLYFMIELNASITHSSPKVLFADGVPDVSDYSCVDSTGMPIGAGILQRGGMYLVCMRNAKFYFMNVFGGDGGGGGDSGLIYQIYSNSLDITKEGEGPITEFVSDDFIVSMTGEGDITEITSDSLVPIWGPMYGIQSIFSPKGTIKIDDPDPLNPTIDSNIRFYSPDRSIHVDQTDPQNVEFSAVFTANITSPDKTITVSETTPGEVLIETNNNFTSEDGTIGISKFSPTMTNLSSKMQVMSADESVNVKRIGNAFVVNNGMEYTSENGTVEIRRPNPTRVDFAVGHPPSVYDNSMYTTRINRRFVSFFRFDPTKVKNIDNICFRMDAMIQGFENMTNNFRNSYSDEMAFDLREGGAAQNSYYYRKRTPFYLQPRIRHSKIHDGPGGNITYVWKMEGGYQNQNPSYGIGQLTAPEPLDQLCILYLRIGSTHQEGDKYKYITRLTPLSDAAYDLFSNEDVEMKTEYWESSEIREYNDFGYLSEEPLPYYVVIDDGDYGKTDK